MTQPAGWRHRTVEVALSVGAVSGVLCVLWALASLVFGLTPLVLVSGSMSPAIETGDLAVARSVPARELEVGDVVSVVASGGVRVTHRVVSLEREGSRASLVLQGDANAAPDALPYEVSSVDRVVFHVPYAGRVVAALSSRTGLLALAGVVAGLLLLGLGRGPKRPPGGSRRAERPIRRLGRRAMDAGVVAALVAVAAVSVRPPTFTTASFTDAGAMTAAPAAYTLPKPVLTCESRSSSTVRISWPASTSPVAVGYTAEVVNGDPLPVMNNGATRYVEVTATAAQHRAAVPRGRSRWSPGHLSRRSGPRWRAATTSDGLVGISLSCSGAGY